MNPEISFDEIPELEKIEVSKKLQISEEELAEEIYKIISDDSAS